jgi:hypothetical protein
VNLAVTIIGLFIAIVSAIATALGVIAAAVTLFMRPDRPAAAQPAPDGSLGYRLAGDHAALEQPYLSHPVRPSVEPWPAGGQARSGPTRWICPIPGR